MTLVCAHRGESWGHLENTLPALEAAIRDGADVVELDVRATADGVAVVTHDATLARLWGLPVAVEAVTWEDVARLRCAGERIPRLEEALDLFTGGDVRVLVDVTTPEIAAAAHAVVAAHPARANAAWCGATEAMLAVRDLDPEAMIYLAPQEVPGAELPAMIERLAPAYLNCDGSELLPADLTRARELGVALSVWTIDDAPSMALLAGLGADSITTNRMHLLQAVLAGAGSEDRSGESAAAAEVREVVSAAEGAGGTAVGLAGWAIRRARRGPAAIDTKANAADLVTDVDRDIETRVREVLGGAFPGHAVVGEEQGGTSSTWTWFCDPVDGTTNYANGIPFSSFSLALCREGRPVVGVVADLAREQVVDAIAGGGVRVDGLPVSPPPAPLAGGVVLTELAGSRPWPGMDELREACVAADATLRIMGSGALSITQVGLGHAAGAVIDTYHDIDHAAAVCIAAEAGHEVTGAFGEPGPLRVGNVPGSART